MDTRVCWTDATLMAKGLVVWVVARGSQLVSMVMKVVDGLFFLIARVL